MRAFVFGLFLSVAVLLPKTGNAQAYQFRTPPPVITAAAADWQVNSDPLVVNGLVYYPTRGFRFFDGQVMMQIGVVEQVPVYGDSTLEPYSVIYVPIGRDRVREYERRRDGELAGTTGSRVSSLPVQSPSGQALREAAGIPPRGAPAAIATPGSIEPSAISSVGTAGRPDRGLGRRMLIESIPRPSGTNGVWLEFNGARWYASGLATSFSPDRFQPVGEYHGFPVYREKTAEKDAIWIAVVKDGPLAPYVRR